MQSDTNDDDAVAMELAKGEMGKFKMHGSAS